MNQQVSSERTYRCCGEWLNGSGGHRMYSGCPKEATWRDALADDSVHFCDDHVGQLDEQDRERITVAAARAGWGE